MPEQPRRKEQYKHTGKDAETMRQRRQDGMIELSKNNKEETLSTKRMVGAAEPNDTETEASSSQNPINKERSAIMQNAVSDDVHTQLAAVQNARKLLSSDRNPPIDDLISSGILPILVTCLSSENASLQFEAAWALTNIASGTSQQTEACVRALCRSSWICSARAT